MNIIPAIDLKDGNCVRLLRGEKGTETIFSNDPVDQAKKWESCGAKHLHIVDLDGAFSGEPKNIDIIKEIVRNTNSYVQVGGGIRELDVIEDYLNSGVSRVILGTAAFKNPKLLGNSCSRFPDKIAVGIDTKGGNIAIKGWTETINSDTKEILDKLNNIGVSMIVHTDIDRDGTLSGIDIDSLRSFLNFSNIPVIASGGISEIKDLDNLVNLNSGKLYGAILGKSIYTGSIDLGQAVRRFQ